MGIGAAARALLLIGFCTVLLQGCGIGGVREASKPADIEAILKAYPELTDREPETALVRRIVDGDTFETDAGTKVRLVGVNTPETHGKAEAFGREASDYTERRLKDRRVLLFRDVSETDRYGRLLRFVFVEGETDMFNERLLMDGYARTMTYPPDVAMADRFIKAERQARQQRLGLWGGGASGGAGGGAPESRAPAARGCAKPLVKGNINAKGDKIFHVPGDPHYKETKPEMWFCSAEEAEAAGFRKPK